MLFLFPLPNNRNIFSCDREWKGRSNEVIGVQVVLDLRNRVNGVNRVSE